MIDKQTDLTVQWGHKKHKNVFSKKTKTVVFSHQKTQKTQQMSRPNTADLICADTIVSVEVLLSRYNRLSPTYSYVDLNKKMRVSCTLPGGIIPWLPNPRGVAILRTK